MQPRDWMAGFSGVLALLSLLPAAEVRIAEVSYHPEQGEDLEFIELANVGDSAVDLKGWSFVDGVQVTFSENQVLAPGQRLVVASNRTLLLTVLGLPEAAVAAEYTGSLDNDGERIALFDGNAALIDELTYDDEWPFERGADGDGASLVRQCFEVPADAPFNWRAARPSPGTGVEPLICPPLPAPEDLQARPIVINEIYYHSPGRVDPPTEFVELYNRIDAPVDLTGWRFDRGVEFNFPPGTRLKPNDYLVVAQDPTTAVAKLGLDPARVLGPFLNNSTLSNSGERLRLVDVRGHVQDEVTYRQDGAWPALADGAGGSLQRVDPMGASGSPGNWRAVRPETINPAGNEWYAFRIEAAFDGPRLAVYLSGAGEALLDDVRLEVKGGDGQNLLGNGAFDDGFTGWTASGNHSTSRAETQGGHGDDGPCGRIVATAAGNGSQHGLRQALTATPPRGTVCVLTLRMKALSGEGRFIARSSVATTENGALLLTGDARTGESGAGPTPLAPNKVGAGPAGPALLVLPHSPAWPTPQDSVTVRVRVLAQDVGNVVARYRLGTAAELREVPLTDSGADGDSFARDGIWSGNLPPAPDDSLIWYSFRAATATGGISEWPPPGNEVKTTGYYVKSGVPEQNEDLRLFYIFTPGALRDLSCSDGVNVQGSLVDFRGRAYSNVGVKFRGETACGYPKRPLRVDFRKGDLFDQQKNLNFNAGWNDKSMLREQFGFDFFRDAGCGHSEAHMARVHSNGGKFHGVYFTIEDPDEAYLKRNRRRTDGGLYKSRTAMLAASSSGFEPRTDESTANLKAVATFATKLNSTNGQALVDFLSTEMDVEAMNDYQAVQVIIIDGDSVVKNWLLYYGRHDLAGDGPLQFTAFPWDLDLSHGQMLLTTDVRNYDIHPLFQTQTYPFHDQGYHGMLNAYLQRAPGDYFVKAFYGRIWQLLVEKFNPEILYPVLDRYESNTRAAVLEDARAWPRTWGTRGTDPDYWRQDFRTFVQKRHAFLTAYLQTDNRTTQGRRFRYIPAPRVKFSEIHYNPPNDHSDHEFVELTNLEDYTVAVGGWDIPLLDFIFPATATIPPHASILVARSPDVLRTTFDLRSTTIHGPYAGKLPGGGGILRIRDHGDNGKYYPETIDVVVYEDRQPWPRAADGEGKSLELPDLLSDNDFSQNWRAGWSPGQSSLEPFIPKFKRGDTNGDGLTNLTDAIATLRFLFQGAATPTCPDAADTDDDGLVRITDAIYTLLYLFAEGNAPPAPGAEICGTDSTQDLLESCNLEISCAHNP